MRKFVFVAIALMVAAPVLAQNQVTNWSFETGDLSGWTQWFCSGWGSGMSCTAQSSTSVVDGSWRARLQINNGEGSFGIYQVVSVAPGLAQNFETWVRATSNNVNWAEVLLYNYKVTDTNDIDSGTISKPYCIWKRDSWGGYSGVPGGYLPTVATVPGPGDSWEQVTGSVTSPTGFVTIAYKWGRSGGGFSGSMYVDAVTLTPVPEPSSLLALFTGLAGLAGLVLRKR